MEDLKMLNKKLKQLGLFFEKNDAGMKFDVCDGLDDFARSCQTYFKFMCAIDKEGIFKLKVENKSAKTFEDDPKGFNEYIIMYNYVIDIIQKINKMNVKVV